METQRITYNPDAAYFITEGYRIIPAWPNNPKNIVRGYSVNSVCTVEDFNEGRKIKLVTGPQPSGEYLVCLDDDAHGAMLARIAEHAPDIHEALVIRPSTHEDGFHAWLKTTLDLCTTAERDPATGKIVMELRARGGSGVTAPTPTEIARTQVLTEDQTRRLLALFRWEKAPEPQPEPEHVRPARPATSSGDAIRDINNSNDLYTLIGASYGRKMCLCPIHNDKTPSLEVKPATNNRYGKFVCRCWSTGCALADGKWHAYFDVYCIKHGLSPRDALKELNPLPSNQSASKTDAQPVQAVEDATPSPDALRKREARAAERDARLDAIEERLRSDMELNDRAVLLAALLLEDRSLQSHITNREAARRLGWANYAPELDTDPATVRARNAAEMRVRRAFKDLNKAGYGARVGGCCPSHQSPDVPWMAAVWTWTPYRGTATTTENDVLYPYINIGNKLEKRESTAAPDEAQADTPTHADAQTVQPVASDDLEQPTPAPVEAVPPPLFPSSPLPVLETSISIEPYTLDYWAQRADEATARKDAQPSRWRNRLPTETARQAWCDDWREQCDYAERQRLAAQHEAVTADEDATEQYTFLESADAVPLEKITLVPPTDPAQQQQYYKFAGAARKARGKGNTKQAALLEGQARRLMERVAPAQQSRVALF